jgi:hypothetical protein
VVVEVVSNGRAVGGARYVELTVILRCPKLKYSRDPGSRVKEYERE